MPQPHSRDFRRAAVAAVCFNARGQVLLQQRTDNGRWALPGGAIEIGETAAQAVVREIKEETGYETAVLRLIGIYSDPEQTTMTYPDGNTAAYVSLLFECAIIGGSPAASDESSAVGWFSPQTLPQPFHAAHHPRVQDALTRELAAFYR